MYNALKDGVEVTGVPLVREAIGNGEIHNKMGGSVLVQIFEDGLTKKYP